MHDREYLDRLGQKWCEMPPGDNAAARQALQNEIFLCAVAVFDTTTSDGDGNLIDVIGTFFLKDWPKFNAESGSLSGFIAARLKYRQRDMRREDYGGQWKEEFNETTGEKTRVKRRHESLDAPLGDDGESTLGDIVADKSSMEENLGNQETLMNLLPLVLNMSDHMSRRAANPTRMNYFRLFFTDDAVMILQRSPKGRKYFQHERDLFRGLKTAFLDFFLSRICRTKEEIIRCNLRLYGELVDGKTMKAPPLQPLPNDVYSSYLKRVEHTTAGESAVSMQRTAYRKFLKENLQC